MKDKITEIIMTNECEQAVEKLLFLIIQEKSKSVNEVSRGLAELVLKHPELKVAIQSILYEEKSTPLSVSQEK